MDDSISPLSFLENFAHFRLSSFTIIAVVAIVVFLPGIISFMRKGK